LEQQIQTLERKNAILDGLAQGGERGELLTQLRQLDPKLDVLTLDENGAEQLSADQLRHAVGATVYKLKRLRERVAAHRLRTARSRYGEIVTFEACRDLLSELEDTVLLEFVVQETDTLIFLVRSEDQQPRMVRTLHNVDVSEWSRAIVQRLSDLTFPDNETWPDQALLAEFFELVEEHIRPEQTICIVPHGPLHRIPFHALRLGGQYLIDRNPIVYAPSASVLAHVVGQSQEEFSHTAVVVGDTREDLPYAQDEARQVARLLSVDATPRSQATRIKLLESIAAARNPRILHIACHGYFDTEDALSSGILAADDDELGNPAILSARDLLDVQFRADLVALSACQSGLSDVAAGDELMGLNRALLIGGTRCVLGSLWRVDDSSTSLLMRYFYEAWLAAGPQREPMSKSRALRFAQRRVRDLKRRDLDAAKEAGLLGSVRDFSAEPTSTQSRPKPDDRVFISVAHWASFALVGDFR
jgi:CHAT domain-containing protein